MSVSKKTDSDAPETLEQGMEKTGGVDADALLAKLEQLEKENQMLKEPQGVTLPTVSAKSEPEAVDPDEELVEVELFYDGGTYKDDVFVSVNGENCLIKRGVPVQIKRKFANVLDSSDKQDRYTRRLIQGYENKFRESTRGMT